MPARHPARYSRQLLPVLLEALDGAPRPWLDPFAGIGSSGIPGLIHGELEHDWAVQCCPPVVVADARQLPFPDNSIGAVVTSPVYGNRMSDHHNARDASRRNTYTHAIGHKLRPGNSGAMQWGDEYRALHADVYAECRRVLMPGGRFVLNIKNHIRKGEEVDVARWHRLALEREWFQLLTVEDIFCPGNRNGANGNLRVEYESVLVFSRP